ncbi:MAG: linear amide C-N hydrolase [Muribaculaceae bacterium]|nr:linear amide C-N hydrolase [Muribaculaceae bacterium]
MKILKYIMLGVCGLLARTGADACSRVVYLGDTGLVMVGRTLDWRTPIPTNIYVYPQGVSRQSMTSGSILKWTSKYASTIAVGYDGGVTEGMNEAGLVMNGLFCKTTVYPTATASDGDTPVMSMSVFISYFLDNFATVDEVYQWLQTNSFVISGATFDKGTTSTLHWALTDRTGDTLLMEFVDGQLKLYQGRDLQVLTNDPEHPQMEAIENYWEAVGGVNMLPGTVRSADRYVRAQFFIRHVPTDLEYPQAFAAINSIMGTVSVPYGYLIEGEPNVSSTQWTSISDAAGSKYYFRPAASTGYFWIDMSHLMLKPGSPILKLDTSRHSDITGCANKYLEKSQGFTPMW